MRFLAAHIKWIMLATGVVTCTMLYPALAPQAALRSMFGETLDGPLAEIIVRNWGALITLVGAMLIYGAYHPPVRRLVLLVAATSKLIFAGLVLAYGWPYIGHAGVAVVSDLAMSALFIGCLAGTRREP